MHHKSSFIEVQEIFLNEKSRLIRKWISYDATKSILDDHNIDTEYFLHRYAAGVFDYIMDVFSHKVEIGICPIVQEFLEYFKSNDITADELFEFCTFLRKAMIDYVYEVELDSRELLENISLTCDKNLRVILKRYTDMLFHKLVKSKKEAIRAGEAKEYFLSNMSHEIRTPLNAILGFVNLLIEEDLPTKHRNYLEIILSSGENLLHIINDILDFSKLRSGEFKIEKRPFYIHNELSHTLELFVASANMKNISLLTFIDPRIPMEIEGDALRINQILSNFLSNAIKFTPDGGEIEVEAFLLESDILKISVSDNGVGINPADLKHIFSAFAQAQHGESKNAEGTGLGLSISHKLAELMGGVVKVASVEGSGSTFWVEIPICYEVEDNLLSKSFDVKDKKIMLYNEISSSTTNLLVKYLEIYDLEFGIAESLSEMYDICFISEENLTLAVHEYIINSPQKRYIILMQRDDNRYNEYEHIVILTSPIHTAKIFQHLTEVYSTPKRREEPRNKKVLKFSGHILVAEDNEANQELIKIVLLKYGLSFDIANDGLEAFNLYKEKKYDLILMDEQMPVMDGTQSVIRIREYEESEGLQRTPISALTANVLKGVKEKGLSSGFDAFLGKPIVLSELESVFKRYLVLQEDAEGKKVEEEKPSKVAIKDDAKISGLDSEKLMNELMLNEDELILLLTMFLKKMKSSLPELKDAIEHRDYDRIVLLAHSIKGSSGNFRIKVIQEYSSEIEGMAKAKNSAYNYEESFKKIEEKVLAIKIL